jgi:hypothetical protein
MKVRARHAREEFELTALLRQNFFEESQRAWVVGLA